ncbi:hypothetical protein HCUR_00358 [Holospora curviuscula]|uniref:Uncharacterized protein n=1 Tax=Holospora curviuscula TaxID=1082868 RepID=A0A2S5RAH1_9PROT|nr:hypothetical protein HCUR_00358 [Holospora curviuscula]
MTCNNILRSDYNWEIVLDLKRCRAIVISFIIIFPIPCIDLQSRLNLQDNLIKQLKFFIHRIQILITLFII